MLLFAALLATGLIAGAQEPVQRGNRSHESLGLGPVPDAAAARLGNPLFQQNCSACHGANARGGIGPNLLRSIIVLHDEKGEEIGQVVHNGKGAMPAFPSLAPADLYDIAEYIHLQVELAANRGLYKGADTLTTGTPEAGKALFAARCVSCHATNLAHIAARYPQPAALLARIAWPHDRTPRQATVTTPAGLKLTGTLTHYDDFETTLKTPTGPRTWPTDTIQVDIPDPLAGHRALLPTYTDDDLHNLTQYLLTLK